MFKKIFLIRLIIQRFWKFFVILIFLSFGFWGFFFLHHAERFSVAQVIIRGNFDLSEKKQLEQIILPALRNNFFNMNLKILQANIQQLPWILRADVTRVWPAEIVVDILAAKPIAQWNNNQFVNVYGEVFELPLFSQSQSLPLFICSDAQLAPEILSYYQQMNQILQPLALKIVKIELNSDQFWRVQLNNGMKIDLGYDQLLTRLARFVKVYPKVFAQSTRHAKKVDLQYEHGMAVQW